MAGRVKGDAQPGRTWNRRFNHPYTARKFVPLPRVPIVGTDQTAPFEVFQAGFGPIAGFRGYNPPADGVPASWPGPRITFPPSVTPAGTVVSIRADFPSLLNGTFDAQLATYFASVPAGAFVTAWHEAEIAGGLVQADVIAMHTRLYGIFNANAPASASYGQIVAVQSAFVGHTGYPLGPWICTPANGGALLDFYGMDAAAQTSTITFADNINTCINAMTGAGVPATGPWTITETAYHTIWASSQAQWHSDGWNVAQAIGAIHYMPFFSPTIAGAYVLWPAPDPFTLRVLQDIAAVSRGDPRSPAAVTPARSTRTTLATSSSASTLTSTFTSNPAAGSKVLAVVQSTGTTATYTVTDNGATPATFTLDASCLVNSSTIPSVYVYRADNITLPGSGTYAVTVTRSVAGPLQLAACAYTGVQNGPPTSTSAITGNSNNPAVNPVTPVDVSSLFFSAFFCDSATNPENALPASGEFTLQQVRTSASGNAGPGAVADAIVADPRPRAGGFTLPDSPNWAMVMAAYSAFPANIQIAPGAEMAWAEAMDNTPQVSVNAGLASASGWAAVNAPPATVTAGVAAATGTAQAPVAQVSPAGALASGSAAALFDVTGSTISLTLTSLNPVGANASGLDATAEDDVAAGVAAATGAALNATVSTGTIATAGLAAATGAALQPVVTVAPAPATAPGSAAAKPPAASVSGTPAAAAAAGAALAPAAQDSVTAGVAAATGAALAPVTSIFVTAGLAAATGAALNATASTGNVANAGLAAATGAGLNATATVAPAPAAAAATAAGLAAATTVTVTAGTARATGVPPAPAPAVQPAAGLPAAAAAAQGAPVATAVTPATATAAGAGLNAAAFTSGAVFAAIAAAIAAARPAQAPFTTGTLTTATSSSSLTATDQRTGGPG